MNPHYKLDTTPGSPSLIQQMSVPLLLNSPEEDRERILWQLLDSLSFERRTHLVEQAKAFSTREIEQKRLIQHLPGLEGRFFVSSFSSQDYSRSGRWLWTCIGSKRRAKYCVRKKDGTERILTLKCDYHRAEGAYLTGAIGEDLLVADFTYDGLEDTLDYSCYGDPGKWWTFLETRQHACNEIIRRVLIDAELPSELADIATFVNLLLHNPFNISVEGEGENARSRTVSFGDVVAEDLSICEESA